MRKYLILFLFLAAIFGSAPIWLASKPMRPLVVSLLQLRFHGKITIDKMDLSWSGPQRLYQVHFSNPHMLCNIELIESETPFWKLAHFDQNISLQNGNIEFPFPGETISNAQITKQADHFSAQGFTGEGGYVNVQGVWTSIESFDLLLELDKVPSMALDQLMKAKGIAAKILGPYFTARGAISHNVLSGIVSLQLQSPYLKSSLQGNITRGILTLAEPWFTELAISPALTQDLAQRMNRDFIAGWKPKSPVFMRVDPQQFSLPIFPLNLHQLRIGGAAIDLGQMYMQGGPSLRQFSKILPTQSLPKIFEVWFTPVGFLVQNGIFKMGRVDALINQMLHLCGWGNVNLEKETLDMTLGIAAETLTEVFRLQSVPPDFVLPIPISGPWKNPSISIAPALAKITSMAASQNIPQKQGKIFGGLLDAFGPNSDAKNTPPPNLPFPWK